MRKSMISKILLSVFCLFIGICAYGAESISPMIRIGVVLNVASVNVGGSGVFVVSDANGKKYNLSRGLTKLSFSGGSLFLEKNKLALPVRIESRNGLVYANKTAYRGYLLINRSGNRINVINVLKIEDYLKGVVPKESNPAWPIETLKAQAVISRTYALANLGKHSSQGFDLCDETHCQVYGGATAESNLSNEAVEETEGEVLLYDGKFAQTVFHATCGGHTESPQYVWGWKEVPEYLEGVKCNYCKEAPYSQWETYLDESLIRKQLSKVNVDIGEISAIIPKGETPGDSAIDVVIKHSKGEFEMNAYKFRLTVDAWRIKSNTFTSIKKQGDRFYFAGRGWGHKVGLCQWGAKGMGVEGKMHSQILYFYYPGTKISHIKYRR
jgi:stage II sporulation protein D